jgi:hypothetical protein
MKLHFKCHCPEQENRTGDSAFVSRKRTIWKGKVNLLIIGVTLSQCFKAGPCNRRVLFTPTGLNVARALQLAVSTWTLQPTSIVYTNGLECCKSIAASSFHQPRYSPWLVVGLIVPRNCHRNSQAQEEQELGACIPLCCCTGCSG